MELSDSQVFIENRTFDEIDLGATATPGSHIEPQGHRAVRGDVGRCQPCACRRGVRPQRHVPQDHRARYVGCVADLHAARHPAAGPGTIYLEQTLRFRRPVAIGDTVTVSVSRDAKDTGALADLVRLPMRQPSAANGDRRGGDGDRPNREGATSAGDAADGHAARARRVLRRLIAGPRRGRRSAWPLCTRSTATRSRARSRRRRRPDRARAGRPGGPHPAVAATHDLEIASFRVVAAEHSEMRPRWRFASPAGSGRRTDEGQPAHRRAHARGRRTANRSRHRSPHEPRVRHGACRATRARC